MLFSTPMFIICIYFIYKLRREAGETESAAKILRGQHCSWEAVGFWGKYQKRKI